MARGPHIGKYRRMRLKLVSGSYVWTSTSVIIIVHPRELLYLSFFMQYTYSVTGFRSWYVENEVQWDGRQHKAHGFWCELDQGVSFMKSWKSKKGSSG